jgi:hypothetical protein
MADFFLPTGSNLFSNINDQGLPVLDQKGLDSVLAKYKSDSLTSGQYRDNYNKFGWNAKSDSSYVRRGPAIVGLSMGNINTGGLGQSTPGIVKAGTNQAPTDADYKKAAGQVGLDYNSYIKPKAFVAASGQYGLIEQPNAKNSREYTDPNTGQSYLARIDNKGNFQTALDQKTLFADVNDKTKDLYVVGNILEGKGANKKSPHASITFKADGSGNLVPITKDDGTIAYQPYEGVSVTHRGASGQFADLAPLALFAAAVAAPYLLGTIGTTAGAAAGAGAGAGAGSAAGASLGLGAGAGLGTGTMAGTMLSGTGALLGNTAALGASSLAALNGVSGALPSGGGFNPTNGGGYGSAGTGGETAGQGWGAANEAAGAGTLPAGNIAPDVAKFIETGKGLLSPEGLPYDPYASGYQIDPSGPAKIGSQCVGIRGGTSLLEKGKQALETAKQAKKVVDAGASLLGGQPAQDGGGGGGGGYPTFLDSEETFLNKMRPSGNSAGLKTVNKEAEENVAALDFDDGEEKASGGLIIKGYAEAGPVTKEKKSKGALEDSFGGLGSLFCAENYFCMQKILNPKFSVCDLPTFLYSARQSTHSNPLKQLRQGLKVNPLATGGLPHKYAAAAPKGHKPEFITGMTGYYACGGGTGQSDDIAAMLHDGDYVMDAETVSALGDGSSKAGRNVLESFREQIPHKKEGGSNPVPAKIADGEYVFPEAFVTSLGGGDNKRGAEILDGLRTKLRAHKRGAPLDKIPPKAKDPIEYIKTGSK